ncbi:MAG: ABC transporter permease [Candidatus Aminicenantes bacterium]|nr:MAG: ABC transporter permease [Candidatus Aminicenantes bacterium]
MRSKRNEDSNPPRLPEWIIRRLAWTEDRFSIQENLHEEYTYILATRGNRSANLWYWGHMLRSFGPFVKFAIYWRIVMFKNYLKIVWRSMNKYKGYSFINIAGLAVGLACCILISLWIKFEVNYDRFHENSADLYQVVTELPLPNGDIRFYPNTPGALAHALKSERPEIRNVSRSNDWGEIMLGTAEKRFLEKVRFVDAAFLEMFSVDFIKGNPKTALTQPDSIILTENIAGKHFAEKDALGQEILIGLNKSLFVTGVIKELPENSFLNSLCLVPIAVLRNLGWQIDEWGGGNYETYLHLEEKTDMDFFKFQIRDIYKKYASNWEESKLTLRPITRIHLYDLDGGGPIVYVYIFSGLSVFILLLAMVNYINLTTARSALRAKEIGVRKTAGAYKQQLAKQILMESILVTTFSGCFAVMIAYFLLPVLNQLTGSRIGFDFSGEMVLFLTGIVILTGVISGIYPAFILSSMNPVRAIKGGIRPGKNSLLLRKVLIAFQFSLSVFMIVVMIGVNKQLKYLKTRDLGYNRDNIIYMGLAQEITRQYRTIQTELMRNPDIISMTRSSSTMDKAYTTTGGDAITWEGQSHEKIMPKTHLMRADPEFIETFQIDMVEGRFFSMEFPHDRTESVVVNQTALKTMDLKSPVGKRITVWNRNFRIIGVIKDFHFYSLHDEIQPLIFINRYADFRNIFIRINTQNILGTMSFIQNKLKDIAPGYIPDLKFLDENLHNVYITEKRMVTGTRYFTLLTIFVSCIGLLGLASFSVRQRTKEIAIRKVLGASEGNIVLQLFKETLICVITANVVICPIAYFVLQGWLQNYAYHTIPGIGIFVFASVLTLMLAFLSVGWNVIKASLANPAENLRYE